MAQRTMRTALLLLALAAITAAHAQVEDLHITARKADGNVLVKCMPTNASTWYSMMQNGATVVVEGRAPITLRHGTPEAFAATNVDAGWKETLALLANEIPAPAVNEKDLDAVVKAGKDFDRHYLAWILLTSYEPALSRLSGFQFELPDDGRDISGNVRVEGLPEQSFRFDHATLRSDLEGIPFELLPGDKAATLRWSHAPLRGHAVAYLIERSTDGKRFDPIGAPVVYDRKSKGVGDDPLGMEWVDPLPANDETWHYRLVALDAFGMRSVDNTVLHVTPREDPALPPFSAVRIETASDGSSTLSWSYPMPAGLKGFQVIHSTQGPLGPYAISHAEPLPASARSFTHQWDVQDDVHYRLVAIDNEGQAKASDLIYRAVADEIPPNVPEGVQVEVDSTGQVTIHWRPVQDRDLKGYRVFKSFQADRGFVQLTRVPIADTLFTDTLSLQRLDKQVYYQVVALDGSYNQSAPSATAVGRMPDVLPPSAPLLTKAEVDREHRVTLAWRPSSSPDVAYYKLQYRDASDTLFQSLRMATPAQHEIQDAGFAQVPHWREYRVLAVDSAGNVSESNLRRAVRRDRTARPSAPKELRATVEDGSVILSWTLDPATEVSHLLVYRQQTNESRPVLVDRAKALAWTTSPMPAKDGDIYRVQAVSERGAKSPFSEAVQVRIP
ncbi:MAG: fibronectin type III domain-containing protein [Flavobacteriales bacterium]|nr:fibronectin type III domain-containing protein [Flavobacteriales bacterium]